VPGPRALRLRPPPAPHLARGGRAYCDSGGAAGSPRPGPHSSPPTSGAEAPDTARAPGGGAPRPGPPRLPGMGRPSPPLAARTPTHTIPEPGGRGVARERPVLSLSGSEPAPAPEMAEQREPRSAATAPPIGRGAGGGRGSARGGSTGRSPRQRRPRLGPVAAGVMEAAVKWPPGPTQPSQPRARPSARSLSRDASPCRLPAPARLPAADGASLPGAASLRGPPGDGGHLPASDAALFPPPSKRHSPRQPPPPPHTGSSRELQGLRRRRLTRLSKKRKREKRG